MQAFQNKDIKAFEGLLQAHRAEIMEDAFVRSHIEELVRTMRCEVLLQLVRPYTRIDIAQAARKLAIQPGEARELFVALIMDERIRGAIDQLSGHVTLERAERAPPQLARLESLAKWGHGLAQIAESIVNI